MFEVDKNHPGFKKEAEPFFRIIIEGLRGDVDGEHFWDAVAEDAVFEFTYRFPGFADRIEGRRQYMDWFAGYGMVLDSADNLHVYKARDGRTIILEYEVHGTAPGTGKAYNNRFCSIVTVDNRKIVHWRDYMDSLAAASAST